MRPISALATSSGNPGPRAMQGRGGANFGADANLHRCGLIQGHDLQTAASSCSRLRPTPPNEAVETLEATFKAAYDSPRFKDWLAQNWREPPIGWLG